MNADEPGALPDPTVRAERERARFRLHLVRHRTALKNRIHATLIAFGHPVPVSDLFGIAGRELLASLAIPEPWATTLARSLHVVDELDGQISACERELRAMGADHPDIELLRTIPGVGRVLGYTIASEVGEIGRFSSAKKLAGYTGLCPLVRQSGGRDDRGPLAKNGPKYLRWALIEAATHAARHPRTRSGTSAPMAGSAASAAPRSPGSTSPASCRRRSSSCSPGVSRSAPAGPTWLLWSLDDPCQALVVLYGDNRGLRLDRRQLHRPGAAHPAGNLEHDRPRFAVERRGQFRRDRHLQLQRPRPAVCRGRIGPADHRRGGQRKGYLPRALMQGQ